MMGNYGQGQGPTNPLGNGMKAKQVSQQQLQQPQPTTGQMPPPQKGFQMDQGELDRMRQAYKNQIGQTNPAGAGAMINQWGPQPQTSGPFKIDTSFTDKIKQGQPGGFAGGTYGGANGGIYGGPQKELPPESYPPGKDPNAPRRPPMPRPEDGYFPSQPDPGWGPKLPPPPPGGWGGYDVTTPMPPKKPFPPGGPGGPGGPWGPYGPGGPGGGKGGGPTGPVTRPFPPGGGGKGGGGGDWPPRRPMPEVPGQPPPNEDVRLVNVRPPTGGGGKI